MRERRALRRAAWRELWPAALLLLGCAIAIAQVSAPDVRPATMWIGLWLVPAALLCGTAAGRSNPRMLAFLLARAFRRERVLASRLVVSLGMLGMAWAIVTIAVAWHDPCLGIALDAVVVGCVLVLALLCGALGSTATDREPLALGIGTLVFSSMACVPLIGAEALDVTLARVIAAGPILVVLSLLLGVLGLGRAVLRMWRDGLPLRDARTIRALVTRCAGAWAVAETVAVVQVWRSASPEAAVPMVVVGVTERGLVLASGSPQSLEDGSRLETLHIGAADPIVAHHVAPSVISDAVVTNGRIVVQVSAVADKQHCSVAIIDRELRRPIDVACGHMSLSPSQRTLAISGKKELAVIDLESASVRMRMDEWPQEREVVGWSDETPISRERPNRATWGARGVFVGRTKVADLYARGMKASPDARWLAYVVDASGPRSSHVWWGRVELSSLTSGERRALVGPQVDTDVIGWLDAEHVATIGTLDEEDGTDATVSIIAATSGEVVASFPRDGVMQVSGIEGPVFGPWIVSRGGGIVQAWSPDGAVLWSERVATFERDDSDARRWAFVEGEIVGLDPRGRWWRHPVPWEVTP